MIKDRALLRAQRLAAAEDAFLGYDFGETELEATGSWEWTDPGDEISRPLFLVSLDPDAQTSDKAYFTVRFAGSQSAQVIEVYAITVSGGLFGVMKPSTDPVPAG